MKTKIFLVTTLIFFTTSVARAQIDDGRYLLGGSINYYNAKDQQVSGDILESFNSSVQFGKVIKHNAAAGIIFSYANTKDNSLNISNQFGAGIFYRKYKSLTKNFYLFGEADAMYNYFQSTNGHFQTGYDAQRYISNGATFSFIPGLSYSIGKRTHVELSVPNLATISFAGTKKEYTNSNTNSILKVNGTRFSGNINLNSNFLSNFGIGFKFFLGK